MVDKTLADWIPTAKSTKVFSPQSFLLYTNVIERKDFISRYQRNGLMNLSELLAIYSLHNEGINTLVTGGLG